MNQDQFISNMDKAWKMKDELNCIIESMECNIREAFKNEGVTAINIKIHPDGFSCEAKSGIGFDNLNRIMETFSSFSLHIDKTPTGFLYRFGLKLS